MRVLPTQAWVSLILVCAVVALTASSTTVGLATANGSFQVNSATVWGNATLLDGSTIETAQAASQLDMNNGARLRLAAESRARVYQGRLVLEKGSGQIESAAAYPIEARTLLVYSASPDTVARVQTKDDTQVLVTALKGKVRVTNAAGVLVANMEPGAALSFDPQAGAAGPTRVSGCLFVKDGKFFIVDQTTHVVLQLEGEGLQEELGNRVEIVGAAVNAEVITVQQLKRIGRGGCAQASAGAGGTGATPAGKAAGGMSTTTIAIIGGVLVGGTLAGLGAAGVFSGSQAKPATSR
jgi:hypothetical protein